MLRHIAVSMLIVSNKALIDWSQKQNVEAWSFGRPEAKSSKRGAEDIEAAQEDVPLIMENGASPDSNGHDRYAAHMPVLLQCTAVRFVELAGRESR